jgi:hypothetical protein
VTLRRLFLILALHLVVIVAACPSMSGAARGQPACLVPSELALTGMSLPHAREAARQRRRLSILAAGGISTAGQMAQGAALTYPARLAARLSQRLPQLAIEVANRGVTGPSPLSRVERLGAGLAETHPDLVIWAPGSTEAGQSDDPDSFAATLLEGVDRVRDAGADLVLIDLQFAPSIARVANLAPYNEAIAGVASSREVPLLRRSDLMRLWAEQNVVNLDDAPADQRVATIRRLFDCLADGLAAGIESAVK